MEETILDNPFQQGNQRLPNANSVLVLGILSIVSCWCYGLIGIVTGVIALYLSSKDMALYKANPGAFLVSSYSNLRAGRICAIVGLSLSGLYILVIVISLIVLGTFYVDFQNLRF